MKTKLIGIDIGGTKCSVITGFHENQTMRVKEKRIFPTNEFESPYEVLNHCAEIITEFTDKTLEQYSAIGISCGGPLDSRNGLILSPPNLIGWDHIEIVHYFQEQFHLPVFLQNDANACALAEWKFGAGRGCHNMIFLTFGTGLGAGLIFNDSLYKGASDMAGEVGHIRLSRFGPTGYGKIGSFEGFCSGRGIAQLAVQKMQEQSQIGNHHPLLASNGMVTAKSIFEMAGKGDTLCLEICSVVAEYLGYGLSFLVDILNPERIIIGSIFARNENYFSPIIQKIIEKECLPRTVQACKIQKAMLAEQIGDIAALTTALG